MNIFPKNIFQVWYQGCENITKDVFIQNKKNWKMLNPTWNYQCVDDKFLEQACLQFSKECYDAYKLANVMHIKIDFGRYVLIYLYGGIYVDMDAYVLRGLDTSDDIKRVIDTFEKENKNVIGLSQIDYNVFESYIGMHNYRSLNNAIMISSPRNPVLEKYIKTTIKNINEYFTENTLGTSTLQSFRYVSNTTGPVMFNNFFENKDNTKDSEIVIFDSYLFEPCTLDNYCQINDKTVAIHLAELSWISSFMKYIMNTYLFIKLNIIIIIVIICSIYQLIRTK